LYEGSLPIGDAPLKSSGEGKNMKHVQGMLARLSASCQSLSFTPRPAGVRRSGMIAAVCVAVIAAGVAPHAAQAFTVTTVHTFLGGSDANQPLAGLAIGPVRLWGTSCAGGTPNFGTVYKLKISNLAVYSQVYAFGPASPPDGACPAADLTRQPGTGRLYGTTANGGATGFGSIFYSKQNSPYAQVYSFAGGSDGANPFGQLTWRGSSFYGTTMFGGLNHGTVFILTGNVETPIYKFLGGSSNDGEEPATGLTFTNGYFFGTTWKGGIGGNGTVYKVGPTSPYPYAKIHDFGLAPDGDQPSSKLYLLSGVLYGTTKNGGTSTAGCGSLFKITPSGTFTTIYNFQCGPTDGQSPSGDLAYANSRFYGTTELGGASGLGTVFEIDPVGQTETGLYSFTGGSDGGTPKSGVQQLAGAMFGTTSVGGTGSSGTIFRIP
jgi:uncharacterized repeat protein (TIGR03803 family)